MAIKVCFDISPLAFSGGVVTYTKELATRLACLNGLEMVYLYMSLRKPLGVDLPNVKRVRLPAGLYEPILNNIRIFSLENMVGQVDIYHSSDWVQAKSGARKITTIHDLIPIKYPQWSDSKVVDVHRRRLKLVVQEVDIVICVSESTKNDLIEVTGMDPKKIRVIYEGVDERFKVMPKIDIEQFRMEVGLPESFVLAIGGIGSRRNLERVEGACKSMGVNLIVTGRDIVVSDMQMPMLYGASDGLIYPSLYEGFGLPILEAMACGVPVVTSDVGAMKEIAGSGAVLVDPESIQSISNGISEVLDNRKKTNLIKKGIDRSNMFSWDKCAEETFALYQEMMG